MVKNAQCRKMLLGLMGLAMLAIMVTPSFAANAISEKRKAQNKLMAQRAARADAMRKLGEQIKGLKLTSKTYVADFVTESDTIQSAMRAFLLGMKEEGKYRHLEDGTCEVTMSVTLMTVQNGLTRIYQTYYKGDRVKITDIQRLTQTNKLSKITVVGSGAQPEEFEDAATVNVVSGPRRTKIPPYWLEHCTGRGRLMAVRAARMDGMRRLAERIKGVRINSRTLVQDFVTGADDINTFTRTFLRGAKEVATRYHRDELIVEVDMQVTLKTVLTTIKSYAETHYRGDRVNIQNLQSYIERVRYDKVTETGMGVPPEKYLKNVPAAEVTFIQATSGSNVPSWVNDTIRATGQGAIDTTNSNAAQAKLMAYRAAELDARRKLAEQLDGLMIRSDTSVRDFVTENDSIRTSMLTYQQGAKVLNNSKKILPDGTAEVTVEIELKPLWNMVVYYMKKRVR